MAQRIELPEFEEVPSQIRPTSTNLQVQLFMYDKLLKYNDNLARVDAWNMVKSFIGDGEGAFTLTKEQWIEEFGDRYGSLLHARMDKERKDSEKRAATDVSGHMLFWKGEVEILNILGRFNMAVC